MNNITVCITTYIKDLHLLNPLLDKFKDQTYCPHEILVYASGASKIDSPPQIKIYNSNIPVSTVCSSKRTMQSIARNICASIASGNILLFFDVDDIPHNQKLEITKYMFDKYNPDFFLHNYTNKVDNQVINKNNIEVKQNIEINTNNTNLHCDGFPIHHAHIAVKKSVFDKVRFNESLSYYRKEDGKFCQDLISNNYCGIYTPLKLVEYH